MADITDQLSKFWGSRVASWIGRAADPQAQLLQYKIWSDDPVLLPSWPELLGAYARGRLKAADLYAVAKMHGVQTVPGMQGKGEIGTTYLERARQMHAAVIDSQVTVPSPIEVYQLLNRRTIDDARANQYLIWNGYLEAGGRDDALSLRWQLPGPSDLVRFALREVWQPEVVEKFGYDAEFPPAFQFWLDRQGLGEPTAVLFPGMPVEYKLHWARAYWRAHWEIPSPTQAYMMLHRLRPNRLRRYQEQLNPADPASVPLRSFGFDELQTLLRVKDYPPYFRAALAAINSTVLTRVDLRRMIQTGQIDRGEVREQYLDRGYVPQDADRLTDFAEFQGREFRFRRIRAETKAQILSAYRVGAIERDAAAVALYRSALIDPRQVDAYRSLPPGEQLRLATTRFAEVTVRPSVLDPGPPVVLRGVTDGLAELAAVDAAWSAELLKRSIAALRRCYLGGVKSKAMVASELTLTGVTAPRREEYVRLWELERDCQRRELTTAKIQGLLRDHFLTPAAADERLTNLGWPEPDRQLLLAEVARDVDFDRARAEVREARTRAAEQRALENLAKAALRLLRQTQRDLARHGNPGQLKRWVVRGIILPEEMQRRLVLIGWPEDDAARETATAIEDRENYLARLARRREAPPVQLPEPMP